MSQQHEFKSVQALRGREGSTKAKWQNQGWELVSEDPGRLRTELTFRRVKPKTLGDHLLSVVATIRRTQPKSQMVVGACALLLVAGIVGFLAGQGGGDAPRPSAPGTTASSAPPVDPTASEISVDELLDTLNSPGMGGVETGDRFRVTAELMASEYWGVGASGDYVVSLEAKGGANDLQVFVDESVAQEWQDGTRVELVLEAVEATIRGETSDGWLRVQSATTIAGGAAG